MTPTTPTDDGDPGLISTRDGTDHHPRASPSRTNEKLRLSPLPPPPLDLFAPELSPSLPVDSAPESGSPPTPTPTSGVIAKAEAPVKPPKEEDNNRPVVKFGAASLNAFDWMSLGPKEWLSDNVLAFWFALIEAQLAERDPATAGRRAVTRAALWPPSLVELLTALPQGTSCASWLAPAHVCTAVAI